MTLEAQLKEFDYTQVSRQDIAELRMLIKVARRRRSDRIKFKTKKESVQTVENIESWDDVMRVDYSLFNDEEMYSIRQSTKICLYNVTKKIQRARARKPVVEKPKKIVPVTCDGCVHDVTIAEFMAGICCKIKPKTDKHGNCASKERKRVVR